MWIVISLVFFVATPTVSSGVIMCSTSGHICFTEQPEDINVAIGQSAFFPCMYNGTSSVPEWYIYAVNSTVPVRYTPPYQLPSPYSYDASAGGLIVFNVSASLNGTEYRCSLVLSSGEFFNSNIGTLLVYASRPCIITGPIAGTAMTATLVQGNQFELQCTGASNSTPTWSRLGDQLPLHANLTDGLLSIRNISLNDSGQYVCTSGGFNCSFTLTVTVREQPPTINGADSVILHKGDQLEKVCTSASKDTLTWSRPHGPLPSQAVVEDGMLTIPNLTPGDSGEYVCTSGAGTCSSFTLQVMQRSKSHLSRQEELTIAILPAIIILILLVVCAILLTICIRLYCKRRDEGKINSSPEGTSNSSAPHSFALVAHGATSVPQVE